MARLTYGRGSNVLIPPTWLALRYFVWVKPIIKKGIYYYQTYRIKLAFQDLFTQPDRESGEAYLKRWYFWATHCRLQPMIEAAKTIKRHWEEVLSWF